MAEMAEMEREAFQEREGRKGREGPLDTREHVGLWDQLGRKVSQERKESLNKKDREERRGQVGLSETCGAQGKKGEPGVQGLTGPAGSVMNCGQIYVRWGRTTCPGNQSTELVYSGRAGGSWWSQTGGATNYLCMPDNPDYLQYDSDVQGRNYVFGVEYVAYNSQPLNVNPNVWGRNVPCAVCMAVSRCSLLMIPGKTSCPVSWTTEYVGYLMSGGQGSTLPTTYECVDKDPNSNSIFKMVQSLFFDSYVCILGTYIRTLPSRWETIKGTAFHTLLQAKNLSSKKIKHIFEKMMVSTLGNVCCTIALVCVISTTVKGTSMQSVESNIIPFSVTAGQPSGCEQSNDNSCPQLLRGRDGRDGRDGERGIPGERREKGERGPIRHLGACGPLGPVGEKGQPGEKGERGSVGLSGATGAQGQKGANGEKGANGQKGQKGQLGTHGAQGQKGVPGERGFTGSVGLPGTRGAQGQKEEQGERGLTGLAGSAVNCGQTYVRWGRTTCPGN